MEEAIGKEKKKSLNHQTEKGGMATYVGKVMQ